MANDSPTVRLLYCILKQKDLKDINWNKVASDALLEGEITNGHAARMRYSRFKKSIEGPTAPSTAKKPRANPSPRKANPSKVEKTKPSPRRPRDRKRSPEEDDDDEYDEDQKPRVNTSNLHHSHHNHHHIYHGTPDISPSPAASAYGPNPMIGGLASPSPTPTVKHEPGRPSYLEESSSQEDTTSGESFGGMSSLVSDPMQQHAMMSFEMPRGISPHELSHSHSHGNLSQQHQQQQHQHEMAQHAALYHDMSGQMVDMGLPVMHDPFAMPPLWEQHQHQHQRAQQQQQTAENGVLVKREPRWDEAYRR